MLLAMAKSCQVHWLLSLAAMHTATMHTCPTQLYNEEVHDLLAPKQMKLPIHESRENGVYVCGLREDIVTCPEQVRVCNASFCMLASGARAHARTRTHTRASPFE
eukprot:1157512-Pelagomonas_calceolata.AAC.2